MQRSSLNSIGEILYLGFRLNAKPATPQYSNRVSIWRGGPNRYLTAIVDRTVGVHTHNREMKSFFVFINVTLIITLQALPKTLKGKSCASRHGSKGGQRQMQGELARMLRELEQL